MNWKLNMYDNGENISYVNDEDIEPYSAPKPEGWVLAGEHGWVKYDNVEFLDISEDLLGNDTITFKYKGRPYESNIVIGSKP